MAITPTLLTTPVGAAATTATSASITPSANQTIYAAACGRRVASAPNAPTVVDSLGTLTWVPVVNGDVTTPAATFMRLKLYRTQVGPSPSPMTVTVNCSNAANVALGLVGAPSGTDESNIGIGTDTAGDPAVTLPFAPGATGTVLGFAYAENANAIAQPSGYTEIADTTTIAARMDIAYLAGTTNPGPLAWSSANTAAVALALELKPRIYTLAAAAGAFTIAGQAANLLANRRLPAGVGVFLTAGRAAQLQALHRLLAGAGVFTTAGQAASLRAVRRLLAGAGAFVTAGQDASLQANRALAAGTGVFLTTGQPAALHLVRVLRAGAGVFITAGQPARLLLNQVLHAGAGVFSTDGQPIRFTLVAPLEAGAFLTAGQLASLRYDKTLHAQPGVFLTAGQPAQLQLIRRLRMAPGVFLTTGQPARMTQARAIHMAPGAFHCAGSAIQLTAPGVSQLMLITGAIRPDSDGELRLIMNTPAGAQPVTVLVPSTGLLFEVQGV